MPSIRARARGAARARGRSVPSVSRDLASAGAAVVPAVREPLHPAGADPVETARQPPLDSARAAFVVRRAGAARDPPAEVLRVARCRGRDGRRDGRGGLAGRGRRGHVGPLAPRPAGRARVRPGAVARRRAGRTGSTCRREALRRRRGDRSPGAALAGPSGGTAMRGVFRACAAPCPDLLLVDDVLTTGRDRFGLRPERSWRRGAREVHSLTACRAFSTGRPGLAAGPSRRPRLSSSGLPSGSVVARGRPPVVDASRGRNDPRKATLGR